MNLLQLCCRMMFGILKVMECESPCVNPLHNLESKTFYTLIALKIWRCLNFFFSMTKPYLQGYQIDLFIPIFEQKIMIVLGCICREILIVQVQS